MRLIEYISKNFDKIKEEYKQTGDVMKISCELVDILDEEDALFIADYLGLPPNWLELVEDLDEDEVLDVETGLPVPVENDPLFEGGWSIATVFEAVSAFVSHLVYTYEELGLLKEV